MRRAERGLSEGTRKGQGHPNMNVREIGPAEEAAYAALARDHGTVFHGPEWTDLFRDRITRLGVFDKSGALAGGFQIRFRRTLGAGLVRDPVLAPQCGPFFKIEARNPVAAMEAQRDILEAMAEYLGARSNAFVTVSLSKDVRDTLPFVWRKFKVVPRYTYLVDLAQSPDEILRGMSTTRRHNVAKAVKDGVTVRLSSDADAAGELIRASFERNGVPGAIPDAMAVVQRFSGGSSSYTCTAYHEDAPISTVFILHDRHTAYYLLGGYRADQKHQGAGALAMKTAIDHAQELGLQTFDFEGSMIPTIERYFRGFGGRLTPYFTVNKAWLPLEMAMKLIRRERF